MWQAVIRKDSAVLLGIAPVMRTSPITGSVSPKTRAMTSTDKKAGMLGGWDAWRLGSREAGNRVGLDAAALIFNQLNQPSQPIIPINPINPINQ
jgi:hypothetical protein